MLELSPSPCKLFGQICRDNLPGFGFHREARPKLPQIIPHHLQEPGHIFAGEAMKCFCQKNFQRRRTYTHYHRKGTIWGNYDASAGFETAPMTTCVIVIPTLFIWNKWSTTNDKITHIMQNAWRSLADIWLIKTVSFDWGNWILLNLAELWC